MTNHNDSFGITDISRMIHSIIHRSLSDMISPISHEILSSLEYEFRDRDNELGMPGFAEVFEICTQAVFTAVGCTDEEQSVSLVVGPRVSTDGGERDKITVEFSNGSVFESGDSDDVHIQDLMYLGVVFSLVFTSIYRSTQGSNHFLLSDIDISSIRKFKPYEKRRMLIKLNNLLNLFK